MYLTVDLRDISDEKITWKAPDHLIFSGISDGKKYGFKLRFFAELDTKVTQSHIAGWYRNLKASKWNKNGLHLQFILQKKKKFGPYWKRLTKEERKFQNIAIDWDKYVDENGYDESSEDSDYDSSIEEEPGNSTLRWMKIDSNYGDDGDKRNKDAIEEEEKKQQ